MDNESTNEELKWKMCIVNLPTVLHVQYKHIACVPDRDTECKNAGPRKDARNASEVR